MCLGNPQNFERIAGARSKQGMSNGLAKMFFQVKHTTSCEPKVSEKCASITYTECQELPNEECNTIDIKVCSDSS